MKNTKLWVAGAFVFLSTGCSVTPEAFDDDTVAQILANDRSAVLAGAAPVTSSISIDEAVARALTYNLDMRTKLFEQSLAAAELEAGKFDMLPKLMANAGYFWRNNENVRFSANSESPDTFTNDTPFISTEREHIGRDATLSWSLLDFGASYYTAKQNADRVIVASERRRKAMHTLIQNVRSAYWRALAAEALGERVNQTIRQAEDALEMSRAMSDERVRSPDEALRYQRNLLENLRLLEAVEREVINSRVSLANLMGLMPGAEFTLVEPDTTPTKIAVGLTELEAIALMRNTDLREKMLDVRIAANDTRKAILKLLPGLSFDYGVRKDDDYYLKNQEWRDASVRVSYNLFSLLSAPAIKRAAKKNEALAEARRIALQMTVLSQVHLTYYSYHEALQQFSRADDIFSVDSQLAALAASQTQSATAGSLREISASVTSILSLVRRYQAMAKVNEAAGQLQASLGLEPNIPSLDDASVAQLTNRVAKWSSTGMGLENLPLQAPELFLNEASE